METELANKLITNCIEVDREELKNRLHKLISNGRQVSGTSPKIDINQKPDYFNEERFKRAQNTVMSYYAHISMASTAGLILLTQIESILVPLLKTGRSKTVPNLFDRYSATAKYIKRIYETDFYMPSSEGWKFIQIVRGMHQSIHKLMNTDLVHKDKIEPPNVWVNQYDMALTQFAFIGLFLLQPSKCAAYYVSQDELRDVTYYWRIISYYFGIEEQFNLFVYHDNIDKQLEYMEIIFQHKKELLKPPRNKVGLDMAKGFMLSFEDLSSDVSFNILDHWWSDYVSLSGRDFLEPYTWSDRLKLIKFNIIFRGLTRIKLLRKYINELYKWKLEKFVASGDKIRPKLERKYSHLTYE